MQVRPKARGIVAFTMLRVLVMGVLLLLFAAPSRAQEAEMPIFDTHLHYSQDAWDAFPTETAVGLIERAGVYRALVSSTPDDGTLRLYERLPDRVVPILRPYRTRADMATWTRDLSLIPYLEDRIARGIYRGFGEFHLSAGEADAPVVRRMAELASQHNLILHSHSDTTATAELAALYPQVKVLWAHAGLGNGPDTTRRVMEQYPNVWAEVAIRSDVAPGGTLDPVWRDLFLRFDDRIMLGSDTWIPPRWGMLPQITAEQRAWLRQLPSDVAERIARGNAEQLFPLYATP